MATGDVSLNPNVRSSDTLEFQNALRAKIVGQDDGVQALVQLRLLHSTIQVKLDQFGGKDELKRLGRTSGRYGAAAPGFRGR